MGKYDFDDLGKRFEKRRITVLSDKDGVWISNLEAENIIDELEFLDEMQLERKADATRREFERERDEP
jgi:hypothetical protein